MKVLFLDESGDHNLTQVITDDTQYPVFVLAGIIVDQTYADTILESRLTNFKREMFGRSDIILHTSDIIRNRKGFEALIDREFRQRFYNHLNELITQLDFQIVACVIKKKDHVMRYGETASDPYLYSMSIVVERFCMDIGNFSQTGVIIAESRGLELDKRLQMAWKHLKLVGTTFIKAKEIQKKLEPNLIIKPKKDNIAGLQLADLVATPIGRKILKKPIKDDYRIIETKFRRSWRGQIDGYGLVILPKQIE